MTLSEATLTDKLDALLDTEKNALLAADFTVLPKILEEKLHLSSLLEQKPASDAILNRLKAKISYNQLLMDETMAAIRHTAQRVAELRSSKRSVSTYNHMGQLRRIQPDADTSVEKKA